MCRQTTENNKPSLFLYIEYEYIIKILLIDFFISFLIQHTTTGFGTVSKTKPRETAHGLINYVLVYDVDVKVENLQGSTIIVVVHSQSGPSEKTRRRRRRRRFGRATREVTDIISRSARRGEVRLVKFVKPPILPRLSFTRTSRDP